MDTTPCKACKATMIWIRSAKSGNLMPLDAEPVPDGNIVILDGAAHQLGNDLLDEVTSEGQPRYKNHFVTCPDRDKFRKARTTTKGNK